MHAHIHKKGKTRVSKVTICHQCSRLHAVSTPTLWICPNPLRGLQRTKKVSVFLNAVSTIRPLDIIAECRDKLIRIEIIACKACNAKTRTIWTQDLPGTQLNQLSTRHQHDLNHRGSPEGTGSRQSSRRRSLASTARGSARRAVRASRPRARGSSRRPCPSPPRTG